MTPVKRSAHWLRRNAGGPRPVHMVFIDTETHPEPAGDKRVRHRLDFGWACYVRRRGTGQYAEPKWIRFEIRAKLWDWVNSLPHPGTKLYIYAHNWTFDALVTGMFSELPRRGWKPGMMVLEGPPVIIDWRRGKQKIRVLDTLNWWPSKLSLIGEELGIPKLPMPERSASRADWDTYCRRDVEVIRERVCTWLDWLDQEDLGVYAPTRASQAWNAWRHRFLSSDILIDADEQALGLARDGYLGARTEAYRIGRVEGPVHELDVNSIYPHVMREGVFPARLTMYSESVTIEELRRALQSQCAMGRVRIDTDQPIYPVKRDKRLVFPTGRFTTTLATPELQRALELGHVAAVEAVAFYDREPMFREFIQWGWAARMTARREGKRLEDKDTKTLMNALYGKLGQRGRHWQTIGRARSDQVEVVKMLDADTGEMVQYRQVAGALQVLLTDGESRDSHPAIAAHVTSYARLYIWDLQVIAGRDLVYYTDTDCIWTPDEGLRRLAGCVAPDVLGALKLEDSHEWVHIRTLKDYEYPTGSKTKGIRADAHKLDLAEIRAYLVDRGESPDLAQDLLGDVYSQERWRGLRGAMRDGDLDAPETSTVIKRLSREYTKGTVQSDGTVLPFHLEEW